MIEMTVAQRQAAANLFKGHLGGYSANAILEGHMGRALADQSNPNFAVLELPELNVSILAGNPMHPSVAEYMRGLTRFSLLFFSSDEFTPMAQKVHPGKWIELERYAFSSENLNITKLHEFTKQLPSGYQVKKIDLQLAKQLVENKQNKFADHHGANFASPADFVTRGFGYCVLKDSEIACVASTFVICDGGMEIQIDTKKKYRQQGLATVAAAHLILDSLANNIDPSWDAATKTSAKFAEKLGYTPQETYTVHIFTDTKLLVYLRNVIQVVKKLWTT